MTEIHSRGSQMQDITGHGDHFLFLFFALILSLTDLKIN